MPWIPPISRHAGICLVLAGLITACTSLQPTQQLSPAATRLLESRTLPSALNAQQRQQWLDRVTWGATDSADEQLEKQGLGRWLGQQLTPSAAPMPTAVQRQIDALRISQQSMAQLQRDITAQRQTIRDTADPEQAAQLRQAVQRQLNQLSNEAQQRQLWRALYSPHQLQEQMTWFWMNHFSVSTRKGDVRLWVGDYEEHAIRPHALGKFRDLLAASMRHPAMLLYLDNASNAAGHINENYARELLELHTMGVGSGYTQADVQAMAHVLTGVGLNLRPENTPPPKLPPAHQADYVRQGFFEFNPSRHDYTPQSLLGQPLQHGGMKQVNEALDRIVATPATSNFIARKLAVYFLGDDPPPAVVEHAAQAFAHSQGDIAATLASLLTAPESMQHFGQRFKDPMHYVLGATRLAYDQRVASDVRPVLGWINQLGQSLYGRETPDGYPPTQSDWSSSGQMNSRFEVARQIGSRGAVLFRAEPQAPLEQPPYPELAQRRSVQTRLPTLSAASRDALTHAKRPADWNSFFLSTPEMMYR